MLLEKDPELLLVIILGEKHLAYYNDDKGNGHVSFKPNERTRVSAPSDWSDLFQKFPSGHRIEKKQNFKSK